MSVEVFTELVASSADDDEVIEKMKAHLAQLRQNEEDA
jgi:hypothetical protein